MDGDAGVVGVVVHDARPRETRGRGRGRGPALVMRVYGRKKSLPFSFGHRG
jgi:hypothetical protein